MVAALALVLLLEGLMPFVAPGAWRKAFRQITEMEDGQIQFFGLIAVLSGLALLWFVR